MRKKLITRFFFLTPIFAFLISYATYFAFTYPQSHVELLSYIDSGLALSESMFDKTEDFDASEMETRILARVLQAQATYTNTQTEMGMSRQTAMQILDSTVRVNSGTNRGSGVLLFEETIDDVCYTYIITNSHVVADENNLFIETFTYLKEQSISSIEKYPATLVGEDSDIDLALLQVKTPKSVGTLAEFQTLELETNMKLYQQIYIAGCPLGEPPLVTAGNVGFSSPIHMRVTAFSIFGNSGGGAFDRDGKLVGIVKGVASLELDKAHRIPEPNLTYIISGPLVRSWLMLSDFAFIISNQPHRSHKDFLVKQKETILKDKK